MRVRGDTSAASILLITGAVHDNGVLEGSCSISDSSVHRGGRGKARRRTLPGRVQRPHVEDVDSLHLADEFETLETGGLVDVCGDSSGFGARGNQIVFLVDLCDADEVSYFDRGCCLWTL